MYYYKNIDASNNIVGCLSTETPISMDTFIQISREEYLELSGNIPPVQEQEQKQESITYEELAKIMREGVNEVD